jgi:hypothetical protein
MAKSQYDASDIVAKLVFFAVFIPFLSAAVGALGIQALQEPLRAFIALIPRILVAIVLVVLGAVIAGAVKTLIQNALGGLSYGKVLANVASILILLGFVKAALDQVGIATTVTGPLLYAILGTVAGVVIVGAGGGLIKPMQHRWEDMLNKASDETKNIKNEAQSERRRLPGRAGPRHHPGHHHHGRPAHRAGPPPLRLCPRPSPRAPARPFPRTPDPAPGDPP